MKRWEAQEKGNVYTELASAYSEPHRYYHTVRHINDCLEQLDNASAIADLPEEIELALWFHDAVYDPASSENEMASAQWAQRFLRSINAQEERCNRVYRHIMATRHGTEKISGDSAVISDIDLSILGRETAQYDDYEQAIRQEYQWVPWPIYRSKRSGILTSFLLRPAIYQTEIFRDLYETQARANLQRAISALQSDH